MGCWLSVVRWGGTLDNAQRADGGGEKVRGVRSCKPEIRLCFVREVGSLAPRLGLAAGRCQLSRPLVEDEG